MTDGYALLAINLEGKGELRELYYFDFRLEEIDFDCSEGLEQLVDQLPDDIKDTLVMVFFKFESNCSQSWEGEWDCEELFNIVSHTIVKTDYKEFSRIQVTEKLDLSIGGFKNIDAASDVVSEDDNYFKNLVGEWEEFYDEDFVPHVKEVNMIESIRDFFTVSTELAKERVK